MKSLQLEKPHAIIAVGIPGSGKSFFAQKFADTFNAPYIDHARFRALARDAASATDIVSVVQAETIKTGRSLVIEPASGSRSDRLDLANELRKHGYVPLFVWVQVDVETAMNRTVRSNKVSPDEYRAALKRFTPLHPSERPLVISGKHTFATQAKAVLKKLSAPRAAAQVTPERKSPTRGQIIVR